MEKWVLCLPSMMAKRKPLFRPFFYSSPLPRSLEPPFYPRLEAHRSIRSRLLNLFVNATLADPLRETLGSRLSHHIGNILPFFFEKAKDNGQEPTGHSDLGHVWTLPPRQPVV